MELNPSSDYQRPVVIARWPARSDSTRVVAGKVLASLAAIETSLGVSLAWSADTGDEDEFLMTPFPAGLDPVTQLIESFVKVDNAGHVWLKGGWTLLLYARADDSNRGDVVSLTGTVGATTERGNSLQIQFLTPDAVPSDDRLAGVVEAVGEIWDAAWCAALSDEIVEEVNKPFDAPGVGFVSYWAETVQPTLPATALVKIRKTSRGTLAELSQLNPESAIEYARYVHSRRGQ